MDAVIVTHQHPDHCVDVSALARVRYYADKPAIPLYSPPGVVEVLRALEPRPDPATVFDVRELATTTVGPFELSTVELPHYLTNLGVRLSAPGVTVAYTGDSGPTDAATYAAGAKRLLLTHFWPGSDRAVSLREAKAVYAGEVLIAEEGLAVRL